MSLLENINGFGRGVCNRPKADVVCRIERKGIGAC